MSRMRLWTRSIFGCECGPVEVSNEIVDLGVYVCLCDFRLLLPGTVCLDDFIPVSLRVVCMYVFAVCMQPVRFSSSLPSPTF